MSSIPPLPPPYNRGLAATFKRIIKRLVLGPESGGHIVLDSDLAAIQLFDSNGILRAELALDPSDFPVLTFYSENGLEKSYIRPFISGNPNDTGLAISGGDSGGATEVLIAHTDDLYRVLFTGFGSAWVPEFNMLPAVGGQTGLSLIMDNVGSGLPSRRLRWDENGLTQMVGIGESVTVTGSAGDNPTFTGAGTLSYAQIGNTCGVVFIAPASGCVKITIDGLCGTNSTTVAHSTFRSAETREGSNIGLGTVVEAPTDIISARFYNLSNDAGFKYGWHCKSWFLNGLTPGDDYNVQDMARQSVIANTGALLQRSIYVEPQLSASI